MWCRHCQQDVPAVASTSRSRLVCSRCESPIESTAEQPEDSPEAEAGIVQPEASTLLAESEDRLRELGRPLRSTTLREESEPFGKLFVHSPAQTSWTPASTGSRSSHKRRAESSSWSLSLLLSGGISGLLVGAGILLWSAANQAPLLWRVGMAATLASEGVLIVGLVWMAMRLWNSSRWVHRNLDGLHDRLDRLEDAQQTVWHQPHWMNGEAFDGYRGLSAWSAEAKPR